MTPKSTHRWYFSEHRSALGCGIPVVSVLNAVDHFRQGDERQGDVLPDRRPTGSLGPVAPHFRPRLLPSPA